MKAVLLCLAILVFDQTSAQSCLRQENVAQWQKVKSSTTSSDYFYIAGLFSVREAGTAGGDCGKFRLAGIQFLEAFLFAVRNAKATTKVLKGLTDVAAIGFDVCSTPDIAIEKILNFEKCVIRYGGTNGYPNVEPSRTFAYIGPEQNVVSGVSKLISSLPKADIAVSSTQSYLTKPGWSAYQFRTVASDTKQLAAIVEVLKIQKVAVVQVVYSSSMMGKSMYESFKMLSNGTVCIEQALMVNPNDNIGLYRDTVKQLKSKRKTRAVILLLDSKITEDKAKPYQVWKVLRATALERVQGSFTWYSTDAWDLDKLDLTGVETAALGSIVIAPKLGGEDKFQYEQFSKAFKALRPRANMDNPWFDRFWEEKFECSLSPPTGKACDATHVALWEQLKIDKRVSYIIQAVNAVVKGLEIKRAEICGVAANSSDLCSMFMTRGTIMAEVASSIKTNSKKEQIQVFDSRGDAFTTMLSINNIRKGLGGTPDIVEVMSYTQRGNLVPVVDRKSDPITYDDKSNEIIRFESKCDYLCKVCAPPTIGPIDPVAPTEDPNLPTTPGGNASNVTIAYRAVRDDIWVIPLMILAGLGIFIVLCFEIYVLSKLIGTKAIRMWRTMWLGQLLLVAVILSYMVCFLFIPTPTKWTCGLIRFGVGASYSMIYAVLLVKLMIILSSKSIGYLKGVYQVLMFLFAWAVQLVIDAEWLILVPAKADVIDGKWQCVHQTLVPGQERLYTAHVISLIYCMLLIVVCTFIAIRTHGITTNHREGIFVGLAAGFSVPLWLAWILVGQLNGNRAFEDPALAYGLFLTATLVLFVMFLPKVRQLNTLGVEGIYLEDDKDDDADVYGSVLYGPPSYKSNRAGSVYMINGDTYANVNPAFLNNTIASQNDYSSDPNSLYLRHPRSAKGGSVYRSTGSMYGTLGAGSKVLRPTRDLTGHFPLNKKAQSEYGYATTKTVKSERSIKTHGTLKRAHSLTDLGAL
ncbi:metabotropic glutamate receptor-like isoform X2 [Lineus longissimus]|uniref:metabotropic glutamate receptor-like isoform X2 n=1 Tax=Lineus longissimus TaxID=88925 RepID=UPI002B4E8130